MKKKEKYFFTQIKKEKDIKGEKREPACVLACVCVCERERKKRV